MGVRPTTSEAADLRGTDVRIGHGPASHVLFLGAVAMVLLGLVPVAVVVINATVRWLSDLGNPYNTFTVSELASFAVLVPDVVLLSMLGGLLAHFRRLSVRTGRFMIIGTNLGPVRVGLDDLISIVIGTPLVWLIYYRHGFGTLFFMTGAQHMLWPVLGYCLAKIWEMLYFPLVRRYVEVPVEEALTAGALRSIKAHLRTFERFRVDNVTLDPQTKSLTITGYSSHLYRVDKGEQRLRELIGNIPVVKEHIAHIEIVDLAI